MRSFVSGKVARTSESQTLGLSAKALRLKARGIDVVSFTAGEPDFPTPDRIKQAGIDAIRSDFTHYTANQGYPALIEAVCNKFSRENNLLFGPGEILVSNGAKQCIYNVLQAITDPGDEILILSPYWVSYPEMVRLADGIPVIIPPAAGFRPDLERLRSAVSDKTKALILNSPVNPSGVVYTGQELGELASIARERGILIISDEIYERIIFDGRQHTSIGSLDGMAEQVVTVNGVSKAFAMTGWRIGYMGGPGAVVEAAGRVQSQATSNANSIAQKAACAALNGTRAETEPMVAEFDRRRHFVLESLPRIGGIRHIRPEGAFYILLDVSSFYGTGRIVDSMTMTSYLLEQFNVALVPGSAFGVDACLRLSYACSMSDLEKGLSRIEAGLGALNK